MKDHVLALMDEAYEKCPYCGGVGGVLKYGAVYIVRCRECGFHTHRCFDTPEDAMEGWSLEVYNMDIHDYKPDFTRHEGQTVQPDDYPN